MELVSIFSGISLREWIGICAACAAAWIFWVLWQGSKGKKSSSKWDGFQLQVSKAAFIREVIRWCVGHFGLILPAALRIFSVLTPLAAFGLAIIMGLATALHASKGEPIVTQVVFLLLTLCVVWGRFSKLPISAR